MCVITGGCCIKSGRTAFCLCRNEAFLFCCALQGDYCIKRTQISFGARVGFWALAHLPLQRKGTVSCQPDCLLGAQLFPQNVSEVCRGVPEHGLCPSPPCTCLGLGGTTSTWLMVLSRFALASAQPAHVRRQGLAGGQETLCIHPFLPLLGSLPWQQVVCQR